MNVISHNTSSFSVLPQSNEDIVDAGDFKVVKGEWFNFNKSFTTNKYDICLIREFLIFELDEKEDIQKELIALGVLKWRKTPSLAETSRNGSKAAKIVNVKVSPRPIQQPR